MTAIPRTLTDLGLPPRPPTVQTPLWEHLLRPNRDKEKSPSLQNMPIIAPPLAPLDKNATSMRVLLHDTQANFEKFAKHVGQLLHEVKETHTEMKTTHSLFERDRESLVGDILDLVNRSQKEVQKSVGTPSQHDTVESLFKDVNHRLSGMDQRLEAIQSFNQTHSQALQSQMQAIQTLLDKQGSIIAAVVPLLPLLQAIPLHIDAAKSSLFELFTESFSSFKPTPAAVSVSTPTPAPAPVGLTSSHDFEDVLTSKRKFTDLGASSPVPNSRFSETPIKKPRLARLGSPDRQGSSSMRSDLKISSNIKGRASDASSPLGFTSLPKSKSTAKSSPTSDSATKLPAPLSSASRPGPFRVPSTPRRPLTDLHIPAPLPDFALASLPRRSSSSKKHSNLMEDVLLQASLERSKTLALPLFVPPSIPGMTPNPSRPPRILRAQENNVKRRLSAASVASNTVAVPVLGTLCGPGLPGAQRLHPTRSRAVTPSILALPTAPNVNSGIVTPARVRGPDAGIQQPSNTEPISDLPSFMAERSATPKERSTSAPLAVVLGKQKERRSPAREGRRFIPLVDSDDEEEEE